MTKHVIHRDLKPANIMVGAFGEVQVMDWGLAKVLAHRTEDGADEASPDAVEKDFGSAVTLPGTIVGTPAYMAPEQLRGERDQLDARADVFGLGAILCEILTGEPPFDRASTPESRLQAAEAGLSLARQRLDACAADPDLVALAKSCLAAEPADRPRDAVAVAEAVSAYRNGVQERLRVAELARVAAETKAAEERTRRRLTIALAACVVGTILLVGGGWIWMAQQRTIVAPPRLRPSMVPWNKLFSFRGRPMRPPSATCRCGPRPWRQPIKRRGFSTRASPIPL